MRYRGKQLVKESFDNLPSGICFFSSHGIVVLINRRMSAFAFALTGRDLQSLPELRLALERPAKGAVRDGDVYCLEDGTAWCVAESAVEDREHNAYTQFVASDVTELYRTKRELKRENQALEETGARLRRLSAEIAAVTREEEILNMKMRVHDELGRGMVASRRILQQGLPTSEFDLQTWKDALRLLKREQERPPERDTFRRTKEALAGIGIGLRLEGTPPEDRLAVSLLLAAVRECATNAVRHAGATQLYVRLWQENGCVRAAITNNGAPPQGEVTEGGGLGSLRARIERFGGSMAVRSTPDFRLAVLIPMADTGEGRI